MQVRRSRSRSAYGTCSSSGKRNVIIGRNAPDCDGKPRRTKSHRTGKKTHQQGVGLRLAINVAGLEGAIRRRCARIPVVRRLIRRGGVLAHGLWAVVSGESHSEEGHSFGSYLLLVSIQCAPVSVSIQQLSHLLMPFVMLSTKDRITTQSIVFRELIPHFRFATIATVHRCSVPDG